MNGPNYRHLDRRKRNIYKKYLDYSNKKVRIYIYIYMCVCVPIYIYIYISLFIFNDFFKGKLDFVELRKNS